MWLVFVEKACDLLNHVHVECIKQDNVFSPYPQACDQFIKCWFKSLIKITLKPLASNIVASDDNNYRDSHNCKSMHVIVLGKISKTETV